MHRPLAAALPVLLLVGGCKDEAGASRAASSASPSSLSASAGADDDVSPAIEVTTPRPSYALSELSDKALAALVTRAGWTPTIVGKSPPGEGPPTIRVAAVKKASGQQFDAVVLVRCQKGDDRASPAKPGEAYFRDGGCTMNVGVRLGIRSKSADSRSLLGALLATTD